MSKNEENSNKNNKENNPFGLPEGYFGSFGKKMMHKIELAEELKEFKILSSIEKKLPFVTPDNYFTTLETKTELAAYPKLAVLRSQSGFVTPELYFETSAEIIKAKIEVAEELKTYPALYAIDKENAFVAPQNYFDGLSHSVREKIHGTVEESSVVKIIHLVFNKKTAYAIAAMLVISLGLYFYNSGDEATGDCNTLACLSKSEILNSNQVNNLDEESLIKLVDPEKLSKNLKEAVKGSGTQEETDYVLENADVNDIADEI